MTRKKDVQNLQDPADRKPGDRKLSGRDPMVGVVVITHGRAAEAMLAAARAILGRIPGVAAVSAAVGAEVRPH